MTYNQKILLIYISVLIIMSIITFIMFGIDKFKAKHNKRRVKEKTLLELTILGGGIGSLIGRIIFRHKTNKIYFSIVIFLSIISQIFLLIYSIWMVK